MCRRETESAAESIEKVVMKSKLQALQDGWGDFCFKEYGNSQCYVCRMKGPPPYPFGRHGNMSLDLDLLFDQSVLEQEIIPVSEPQVATFPFLDLPLDIRKLVYDQLIEPFCNADGDIQMQLVRPNYELKTHPFRKRHALIFYGDTITSRQMGDPPNKDGNRHLHVDYEDYQALWSLPGVSRQIREEFASIFWPHVTLTCPLILCIPDGNFDHIEEFLQHRQQAVHTLKSFSWALILESNIEKAQQDLKSLFSVMEERAAINGMELGMCIGESVAQELLLDPDLPWIQTFRRIKKELWLDDELLPATREQLHGFLNPKVLLEKGSTAGEEYLLVREC